MLDRSEQNYGHAIPLTFHRFVCAVLCTPYQWNIELTQFIHMSVFLHLLSFPPYNAVLIARPLACSTEYTVQSARLSLQSSELALPPHTPSECCDPFGSKGGGVVHSGTLGIVHIIPLRPFSSYSNQAGKTFVISKSLKYIIYPYDIFSLPCQHACIVHFVRCVPYGGFTAVKINIYIYRL